MYMNTLKTIFLNLIYVIWWISIWSIFDYMINVFTSEEYRLLAYFIVALISLYVIQANNVSLK